MKILETKHDFHDSLDEDNASDKYRLIPEILEKFMNEPGFAGIFNKFTKHLNTRQEKSRKKMWILRPPANIRRWWAWRCLLLMEAEKYYERLQKSVDKDKQV